MTLDVAPSLLAAALFEAECGQPPHPIVKRLPAWSDRVACAERTLAALERYGREVTPPVLSVAMFEAECGQLPSPTIMRMQLWTKRFRQAERVLSTLESWQRELTQRPTEPPKV